MEMGYVMEQSQYALPVIMVLLCAILVFTFGFKKPEQPPFAQLSGHIDADKKLTSKKRTKAKEKKTANGYPANEKSSPAKKSSSIKTDVPKKHVAKVNEVEDSSKEQKQESNKNSVAGKKVNNENRVEQAKNKKNLKNSTQEKPVDYDDGDWEQAYSRKDKKNKKKEEETPLKKNKKTKKADIINEVVARQNDQEKPEIKDKTAKETENKELKEKDEKEVTLESRYNEDEIKEEDASVQEVEKKIEKSKGKEDRKNQKSKKSKKISESEIIIPAINPAPLKSEDIDLDKIKTDNDVEKKVFDNAQKHNLEQSQEKPTPVFDELSDLWTEAKPLKKSKKKARKDN